MSRTSKLCQVVYHSIRLDGTRVFYFVVTLDQKTLATNQTNATFEIFFLQHIAKIDDVMFWLAIFGSSTQRRRTLIAYWESWGHLSKKHVLLCKILISKIDLIWPDLDMTFIKSKVGWRHRVVWLSPSMSASKMTQKTYVAMHICDFYLIVNFCDLTLTFLSMHFVLMQYPLLESTKHVGAVWPLCSPSNRPESRKGENVSLWHLTWP